MPSAIRDHYHSPTRTGIIKFINCRLVKGDQVVHEDLWINSSTGKVIHGQTLFYGSHAVPDRVIDLGGRLVSPGLIDVQFNGGFGFDFSQVPEDITSYAKGVAKLNKSLVQTGVTSYLPTIVSQKSEVYHKTLPYIGPSGSRRIGSDGSESLGSHCEGPFLNASKCGIHSTSILRPPTNGFADLLDCYGESNMSPAYSPIKLVTLAPELEGAADAIEELVSRGIVVSIGHSEATYEEATTAITNGATMITHLFNAMRPLHHRNPGIFGVLGTPATEQVKKPYFGVIADGVHLHPTSVTLAWNSHPSGFVLVTDAMSVLGMPDGTYDWTNGERFIKKGHVLTLEGTDGTIAGCAISLLECVNNFLQWSGATIPQALGAATSTPAAMLGLEDVKGSLEPDADADLLVLTDDPDESGNTVLKVDQVWKFGEMVHSSI
ncbi:carbohydrate esterase family 9 protein [Aulographum hederae CBS 113979]|uniref:N-acetylglucosamine-6-phosphate deacetylase n=1 Tax=Aulographum hederae CBS 113979 TaxID=1176131 RepID=A0A6G1H215_9PEZI|nr:carbohydrate esterase family 9 protein [Aulographum hederae CBS 113979]